MDSELERKIQALEAAADALDAKILLLEGRITALEDQLGGKDYLSIPRKLPKVTRDALDR